jgi:hypothetical protein
MRLERFWVGLAGLLPSFVSISYLLESDLVSSYALNFPAFVIAFYSVYRKRQAKGDSRCAQPLEHRVIALPPVEGHAAKRKSGTDCPDRRIPNLYPLEMWTIRWPGHFDAAG